MYLLYDIFLRAQNKWDYTHPFYTFIICEVDAPAEVTRRNSRGTERDILRGEAKRNDKLWWYSARPDPAINRTRKSRNDHGTRVAIGLPARYLPPNHERVCLAAVGLQVCVGVD